MSKYWYCGNIPPRPLDEKVKDLDGWNGIDKKKILDQSKTEKEKKIVLKQNFFHKTLVVVCECGRLEVGRLDCGRLGLMCRLGQLGRLER